MPLTPTTTPSTPLPLPAYHCHDYSLGTGSDSPLSHAPFISPVVSSTGSLAVSPTGSPSRPDPILSSSPPSSSSISPLGLDLYVDLFQFSLQQVLTSVSSTSSQVARTHSMVLCPRPSKNINLSVASASWVASFL